MAINLKERENFLRHAILVVDHSKDVVVCLLNTYLKQEGITFEDFINNFQHGIFHLYNCYRCCQCPRGYSPPRLKRGALSHKQLDILFDHGKTLPTHICNSNTEFCCCKAKQSISTDVLDLALARVLLFNFCRKIFWDSVLVKKGTSLEDFLNRNKHDIYHLWQGKDPCCMCPFNYVSPFDRSVLDGNSWRTMFNYVRPPCAKHRKRPLTTRHESICSVNAISGIGVNNLDDYTAYKILSHFCPLMTSVKTLIIIWSEDYVHTKDGEMTDSKYAKNVCQLEGSIVDIATHCGRKEEFLDRLRLAKYGVLGHTLHNQHQTPILDINTTQLMMNENIQEIENELQKKHSKKVEELKTTNEEACEVEGDNKLKIKFLDTSIGNSKHFKELILKGTYKSYENRVFFAGPCLAGKSSLASIFIGGEIPKTWISTNGLSIYYGKNGIDLRNKKMVPTDNRMMEQSSIDKIGIVCKLLRAKLDAHEKTSDCRQLPKDDHNTEHGQLNETKGAVKQPSQLTNQNEELKEMPMVHVDSSEEKNNMSSRKEKLPFKREGCFSHCRQTEESLREETLDRIRSGQYEIQIAPSHLVDFGGQRCFDMTHQLFIQHKGAFVLLFDGSKGLRIGPDGSDIKAIDTLIHWVNSVLFCCDKRDDKMPMILFGATHKDTLPENEVKQRRQEYIVELTKEFSDHKHHKHIRYNDLFFIDATDQSDPEIKRLQDTLVEIAFSQRSWGERMPVAWVPLEMSIFAYISEDLAIIRKEELEVINKNNEDLALSPEQLEYFLRMQHSFGKLMYFNQPGLKDFVIVQPTAMVNILRSFVTDKMFWPHDLRIQNIFERLQKTGIIRKDDLYLIWSKEPFSDTLPTDDYKDFVIHLLLHLDILVDPKNFRSDKTKTGYFLVPCMVTKSAPQDMFFNDISNVQSICLSYDLKNLEIPSALAYKIIGAATDIWTLKERDKKLCFYLNAAEFNIDYENEMRIVLLGKRMLVCLFNKRSKHLISPDVAASIQECLTFALTRAIEFYQRGFGKYKPSTYTSQLFEIEFGEICKHNDVCTISLPFIEKVSGWKCKNDVNHDTSCISHWVFEKTKKQCDSSCSGPSKELLMSSPSDKHLVRIAKMIGIKDFYELIIGLGLSTTEWDDLEDQYQRNDSIGKKFMSFISWKKKKDSNSEDICLRDILPGIEMVASSHILCQILREESSLVDIADGSLQVEPTDMILKKLPNHMGNCVIQLGIELGLSCQDIVNIMFRHPKNLYQQLFGVLKLWKSSNQFTPTIYKLMVALQQCECGGLSFLKEQFEIK